VDSYVPVIWPCCGCLLTVALCTALHLSAQKGALDIVKLLISKGADKEVQDERHATPLFFAAEKGELEIAEYLIGLGANVNAKKRNDTTVLHIAAQARHSRLHLSNVFFFKKKHLCAGGPLGVSPAFVKTQCGYQCSG